MFERIARPLAEWRNGVAELFFARKITLMRYAASIFALIGNECGAYRKLTWREL
jgi:hypothetical protein